MCTAHCLELFKADCHSQQAVKHPTDLVAILGDLQHLHLAIPASLGQPYINPQLQPTIATQKKHHTNSETATAPAFLAGKSRCGTAGMKLALLTRHSHGSRSCKLLWCNAS